MDLKTPLCILAKTTFVAGGAPGKVDGVCLSYESCKSPGSCVDLVAIVCKARAVDIEASENFGDRFIEPKNNLNVACWISADNCYCILSSNGLVSS